MFGANDDEVFTTTPKDTEVFVGEDVQFDWEYAAKDVREVRFGVQDPETKELKVVAIYVKKKDGTVIFNNQFESIKWIRDRVEVVPGRRASFKINKVEMRDSGTFFCVLMIGEENKAETNGVELKVVGEYKVKIWSLNVYNVRAGIWIVPLSALFCDWSP